MERSKISKSRSATSSSNCSRVFTRPAALAREIAKSNSTAVKQQLLALEGGGSGMPVNEEGSEHDGGGFLFTQGSGEKGAANDGAKTGEQLTRGECFGEIVVGSEFEPITGSGSSPRPVSIRTGTCD